MCVKCRTWNLALEPGPRGEEDFMHVKPNRLEQFWALWLVLSWWHNRRNNGGALVIQLLPLWDWQELDYCCSFLSRALRPSWPGLTLGCHGAAGTELASGLRQPQLSLWNFVCFWKLFVIFPVLAVVMLSVPGSSESHHVLLCLICLFEWKLFHLSCFKECRF